MLRPEQLESPDGSTPSYPVDESTEEPDDYVGKPADDLEEPDGYVRKPADDVEEPADALFLCEDTCAYVADGWCDDGGDGSLSNDCVYGSDCWDCGVRGAESSMTGRDDEGTVDDAPGTPPDPATLPDPATPPDNDSCEPGCDGNVAVTCNVVSGVTIATRTTCGNRTQCNGGQCQAIPLPSSVTIRADFGRVAPIFVGTAPSGLLSIQGAPSLSAELPALPNLFGAEGTVVSPSLRGCEPRLQFGLNRTSLSASIGGSGGACVGFLTYVAEDGLTVTFENVRLQDGTGEVDVRVEMTP